jgi:hypothetical protein
VDLSDHDVGCGGSVERVGADELTDGAGSCHYTGFLNTHGNGVLFTVNLEFRHDTQR